MRVLFRHNGNRHVYQKLGEVSGKSSEGWEEGVLYKDIDPKSEVRGRKFWTTKDRFEKRFTEIKGKERLEFN